MFQIKLHSHIGDIRKEALVYDRHYTDKPKASRIF